MQLLELFKSFYPFALFLLNVLITFLAIVIAWDDFDTYRAIKSVLKKKISSKVEERNELFEAITTTKGHTSRIVWKRYLWVFLFSLVVEFIKVVSDEYFLLQIITSAIQTLINSTALSVAVCIKHELNRQYDRLRRNNQDC